MITCPNCGRVFPNGTIICPDDGSDFVPADLNTRSHAQQSLVPQVHVEPTLEISVDDLRFCFSLDGAGEPPLRIGRRDLTTSPQIKPDVDLTDWLDQTKDPTVISRIQAAIERQNGELVLRTLSNRLPTFHRRSGQPKARPLTMDEYVVLEDYDMVYLNHPSSAHVTLRIRFLHP